MVEVKCDICGRTISLMDRFTRKCETPMQRMIGRRLDVCPKCSAVAEKMAPTDILFLAWEKEANAAATAK